MCVFVIYAFNCAWPLGFATFRPLNPANKYRNIGMFWFCVAMTKLLRRRSNYCHVLAETIGNVHGKPYIPGKIK